MATHPDPLQHAVALRYAGGDAAPVVVARGQGMVADEIVRRAHEAGIFVHESPELVALLMQVDLDARIPPALYVAVAELLAWIYRVETADAAPPAAADVDVPAPQPAKRRTTPTWKAG